MADNECLVISLVTQSTNIKILENLKKIIYPDINKQINIHRVAYPSVAYLPQELSLRLYKRLYFQPLEYTFTKFIQKNDIKSIYSGELINFNGLNQLSKLTLNYLWSDKGVDVPKSIKVSRSSDMTLIPETFFPAVIFSYLDNGREGSKHTIVNSANDINKLFNKYTLKNYVLIQKYIDFKHDNYYHKGRVIKIGNKFVPLYTQRSSQWLLDKEKEKRNYEMLDLKLTWFEEKIGRAKFLDGIKLIADAIKMDNYAIDFCINERYNVVPFKIIVPYATNIYKTDNEETRIATISYLYEWLTYLGVEVDYNKFTDTINNHLLTHESILCV